MVSEMVKICLGNLCPSLQIRANICLVYLSDEDTDVSTSQEANKSPRNNHWQLFHKVLEEIDYLMSCAYKGLLDI